MQITEIPRKEPFIKLWRDNYFDNYKNGELSNERSKPFSFLLNTQPYAHCPIVLVGAGPSIDNNVNQLKDYQNKALILCADINIYTLLDKGIKPDFVVNIDPHELISAAWHGVDTSNLILIAPTTIHPKSLEKWKGKILFFNQSDIAGTQKQIELKHITKATSGYGYLENKFFVGATMMLVAKELHPSVVILAGYDFAFSEGKTYCNGVLRRRAEYELNYTNDEESIKKHLKWLEDFEYSLKDVELQVDGKPVPTKNMLCYYADVLTSIIVKGRINVVNSTEGGIYNRIDTMPLKDSLGKYCDKEIIKKDIFNLSSIRRRKRR